MTFEKPAEAPSRAPLPPTRPDRLVTRELLQDLAARTLAWVAAAIGLTAVSVALLEHVVGSPGRMGAQRLGVGLALLLTAAVAQGLRQRGHAPAATGLVLAGMTLSLLLHAFAIGLGAHTVVLAGIAGLICLAGGVAGTAAAVLLAALYLGGIAVLAGLEVSGVIAGSATALQPNLADRVLGHVLVGLGALAAALLLNRILGTALRRAMTEEQRLAGLARVARNWNFETDTRYRLTYLSDDFELLSGRSREEFLRLGQPGGPRMLAEADAAVLRQDLRNKRAYVDRVVGFMAIDGSRLWTLSSGEPVFDARGQHTGWRGISHNITAEREAQLQHKRTADMLDRLIRVSPDAVCVASLDDGALQFANAGFCQMVGRSEAELLGKSGIELGLWASPDEAHRLRNTLRSQGSVQGFRSILHLRGGHWRDVLISGASFEWDEAPVAVIVCRDITELERARIEGDAILDNASVGIALARGERFERVNPQWRELFGGTELRLADPDAPGLPTASEIAEAAQAFERELLRPDGRVITVRFNARALPQTLADSFGQHVSPDGARVGGEAATIWVAEDVTARRRQERELGEAKRQAEAASAAKGAFLATMSHEIRTPLNGVIGLARLMQQAGPGHARSAEYLKHLLAAAESLNEIVTNVLDLSKIEAGALAIEVEDFDLHALARASFEGCAAIGRERGLSMACRIEPGLPRRVRGDALRVRQIMANFLGNALKFTERGSISLELCSAGPGRVRLAVHDSGCGVPVPVQAALFQPFAQADGSVTRRFGGTGLGLSICRELAERMGGAVGLTSDGHSGSSFWAELALPAAATAPAVIATPPRYPLAGLRLLVAEDNPVNRLIVAALLQGLGAEVVEAEDGAQAVQLAIEQAQRLDAVLMDLHMPLIDGLRATQLLRANPATARLPVHAFTAAALDSEREAARAAGMDGFLVKPVDEADLIRLLRPRGAAPSG